MRTSLIRHIILAMIVGLPCAQAQNQPQITLRIKQGQTIDAIFGLNLSTATSVVPGIEAVVNGLPTGQRAKVFFMSRYTPRGGNVVVGQHRLHGNFNPLSRVYPPSSVLSEDTYMRNGNTFGVWTGYFRGANQTTAIPGEVHGTYTVYAEFTINGQRYPSNVLTGTVKTAGASPPPPVQQQGASGTQLHRPTTVLRMRFNPKTGKMEVIKNGVISRRGFKNFQGKKLNRRQSLRSNYRFR